MKKNYTAKALKAMTVTSLIKAGIVSENDTRAIAIETIERAKRSEDTITVFLQKAIRSMYKAGAESILLKGYQGWKGTEYHDEYRWVNTVQARARQIEKAITESKSPAKKSPAKKSPAEKNTVALGKEKMKTTAQKKRADDWKGKANNARVALKTVQTSSKAQLKKIAELEKKVKDLEKKNQRITREFNGHKKVYDSLLNRIKSAKTITDYQAII